MSYWAGLIRGVSSASEQARKEAADENARQSAIESKVFETLAGSDDPEIQSLAVSGMLTSADPNAKKSSNFFRRFLGQQEAHPMMGQIKSLIQPGSAALPDKSPVQPGAPPVPPALASPTGATVTGPAASAAPTGRQLFMSPMQKAVTAAEGSYRGRIQGVLAGYRQAQTPAEQRLVTGVAGAPERMTASQSGTIVYDDGTTEVGSYDPYAAPGSEYTTAAGVKPAKPIKDFRKSGLPSTGAAGSRWLTQPDKDSPTGYSSVHVDADGNEIGRAPVEYTPATAFQQGPPTAGGQPTAFDPRGGGLAPIAGAPAVAVPGVGADQAGAKGIIAQAEREAQRLPSALGGGYQAGALDAVVKKISGGRYKTYAEAAAAANQSRVDTAPPTPPGGKPAAPAAGGLDIDAIRQQIQKNRQVH